MTVDRDYPEARLLTAVVSLSKKRKCSTCFLNSCSAWPAAHRPGAASFYAVQGCDISCGVRNAASGGRKRPDLHPGRPVTARTILLAATRWLCRDLSRRRARAQARVPARGRLRAPALGAGGRPLEIGCAYGFFPQEAKAHFRGLRHGAGARGGRALSPFRLACRPGRLM